MRIKFKKSFLGLMLFSLTLRFHLYGQAPTYQWNHSIHNFNYGSYGNSSTLDASGNIYTIGTFGGTVDFDPGPGQYNLTAVTNADIFIRKVDRSRNLIWVKSIGALSDNQGFAIDKGATIKVDASGNVYTVLNFSNPVDLDPGTGVFNVNPIGSDIFINKLDALGNFVWTKQISGTDHEFGTGLTLDGNGNVIVTGTFKKTVDFDPGNGVYNLTSMDFYEYDIFICKLDGSGNFVWANHVNSDYCSGGEVTSDVNGNVYATGYGFGGRAIVCKLDPLGNFVWNKNFGVYSFGSSIAVDNAGNVYTTGRFDNTADFDPGMGVFNLSAPNDDGQFISKLDANGNFVWAKGIGGDKGNANAESITVDNLGNVYTAGAYTDTVDFDPGPGEYNLITPYDWYDYMFASKYDADGNFVWVQTFSQWGIGSGSDRAFSIVVDDVANVFITSVLRVDASVIKLSQTCEGLTLPVSTTNANNLTICSGSTTTLSASSSGTINWYKSGELTPFATGNTITTPSLTQNTSFYLDATNGTCTTQKISIDVNMASMPSITSTIGGALCDSGSVQLKALPLTKAGNFINWYDVPTGGTSLVTDTVYTTPKLYASKTYYAEVSNNCFTSARKAVAVTVTTTPSITSVTPGSGCQSNSILLKATASGGTINWYSSPTSSLLANGTSISTTLTSTQTYYVDASNGNCKSSARIPVTATVIPTPVITSTTPGSGCNASAVTMSATSDIGVIDWYTVQYNGTSVGSGTSFTTPTPSSVKTYYVGATNLGCTSTRTAVNITTQVSIDAVTAGSVCESGTVDLAVTSSSGTIDWYDVPIGGTSLGTGLTYTSPVISTTTTYYAEASNGVCVSERKAIIATVNTMPSIVSATPAARCGSGKVTLSASAGSASVRWYADATGGASLYSLSNFQTPTLTSTTTYYVEAVNGACTLPTRTPVVATINILPSITSTSPASGCIGTSLVLGATSNEGTLEWYSSSSGGTPLGTGNSFTTPTLSSTKTYYVAANNGTCSSARSSVIATVSAIPTITSTNGGSLCSPGTVLLTAGTNTGTLSWYNASTGGTLLGTGNSFLTPTISVTTTYYVESTSNGCTSPRTAVIAAVNNPVVTTTAGSRCGAGVVTLGATTTMGTLNWYNVSSGGSILATGTSYTSPSISTTTTYYVSATAGSCTSARVPVVATIATSIPAQPSTITGGTSPCISTQQTYSVTSVSGVTYNWTVSGGGTISGTGNSISVAWGATKGTYTLTCTPSNACGTGTARTLTVNVITVPDQPLTISNPPPCYNVPMPYSVNNVSGVTYTWSTTPNNPLMILSGQGQSTVMMNFLPGSYTLTVTPSNACGTGLSRSTNVMVLPPPTQPSTITGNSNTCIGSQSYSVINISGITYNWSLSGGGTITGSGNSASVVWNAAGTYTITCTAYNNGCTQYGTARTLTVNVASSVPSISNITGSTQTCIGNQPYNVTNVAGVAYNWSISGGGTLTSSGNTASVNWTNPGSYTVTCLPSNSCGSGTVKTIAVTVSSTPSSISDISGNTETYLETQSYNVPDETGTTFNWSISGGGELTQTGNTASVNWTSPGTYELTCTPSNTCGTGTSASITVTVSGLVTITDIIGNTVPSLGSESYSVLDVDGTTYSWTLSGGGDLTQEGNIATVNWTSPGSYELTCTPINSYGTGTAKTITVTVLQNSMITISGNTETCLGTQSYSVTNEVGITYNWSISGGGVVSQSGNTVTVNWTSPGSYELTCTPSNANGTSIEVTVHDNPESPIVDSPISYCHNKTATTLNAITGENLLWYTSITAEGLSTAPTPNTSVVGTIEYYVSQTVDGCESAKSTIAVTVKPLPTISVSNEAAICMGSSILLTANGADSYEWLPTDGLDNPNQASTMAAPSENITYTVTGTANGCSNSNSVPVSVNTCTGTNESQSSNIVSVSPNPTRGDFVVKTSDLVDKIIVTDVLGITVAELKPTSNFNSFNISGLNDGIYFVTIMANQKLTMIKIVKQY